MIKYHKSFGIKQKGFSVVELMIAGLLGIILLSGVVQLFFGSNQNYTMQDELATVQEDGRFALMFMGDQVEMAGWAAPGTTQVLPAIDFLNSSDGVNDIIALTYIQPSDGVNNIDCNGTAIAGGVVTNQFSVNVNNELVCTGITGNGVAQPLISGVQSFQVLYGVETELVCPDGAVDRYMTRTEVNDSGLTNNVISVRIGLLLSSGDPILLEDRNETFQVLDISSAYNDRIVRRLFQETIFMPNAAFNVLVNSDASVKCMSGF